MTKIRKKAEFLDAVALQPKQVDWVIEGLCAKGKVSVIASEPGVGASLFVADVVARVSSGKQYPVEVGPVVQGSVLFVFDDNEAAERTMPRLLAANVDRNKIHLVQVDEIGDDNNNNLGELLDGLPLIDLLVIDVKAQELTALTSAVVTKQNEHLSRLRAFAKQKDLAVVTVFGLAPGSSETGLQLSSLVQSDASIVSVLRRSLDNSRNLLPFKNTLCADTMGYSFSIVEMVVGEGVLAPVIQWDSQFNASITRCVIKSSYAGRRAAANTFARDHLFDGKKIAEYLAEAKAVGLSEDMVKDAAKQLKFESKKEGFGDEGCWVWREQKKENPKKTNKKAWG